VPNSQPTTSSLSSTYEPPKTCSKDAQRATLSSFVSPTFPMAKKSMPSIPHHFGSFPTSIKLDFQNQNATPTYDLNGETLLEASLPSANGNTAHSYSCLYLACLLISQAELIIEPSTDTGAANERTKSVLLTHPANFTRHRLAEVQMRHKTKRTSISNQRDTTPQDLAPCALSSNLTPYLQMYIRSCRNTVA